MEQICHLLPHINISILTHSNINVVLQRLGLPQLGWHGTPGTPAGPIVKKTQRIEVPVDKYPNVWMRSKPSVQSSSQDVHHLGTVVCSSGFTTGNKLLLLNFMLDHRELLK